MHLSNATASRDNTASSAAPLVLAFAAAELKRRAANYRAVAAHALCWLAASSAAPFQPLDEKKGGTLPEYRCGRVWSVQARFLVPPIALKPPLNFSPYRVAETRKGFQSWLSRMGAGAAPTQEQGAVIAAAALFEQMVDQVQGAASSARLLRNAISRFPFEVSTGQASR